MNDLKLMNIEEFKEKGYLQEVNRQFFHPLGLSLAISIDDNDNYSVGPIYDYREDPTGISFGLDDTTQERIDKFKTNAEFIQNELASRKTQIENIP